MGHPRKQLNFTLESLQAAESALKRLSGFAEDLCTLRKLNFEKHLPVQMFPSMPREKRPLLNEFCAQISDDLNTPADLELVHLCRTQLAVDRRAPDGQNLEINQDAFQNGIDELQ